MKLNEVIDVSDLHEHQLNEITAKQVIAAGAIALATLGVFKKRLDDKEFAAQQAAIAAQQAAPKADELKKLELKRMERELSKMAKIISHNYKKNHDEALSYAALAKKYEKPTFPTAKDLVTLMGVESSFNSWAVSKLKDDPAIGLLQIRPKKWGLTAAELKNDVSLQVEKASEILHKLYVSLGSEEKAIKAYNIGKRNFLNGEQLDAADRYFMKYQREIREYDGI